MTDAPSGDPSEDPRDALIREQARLIAAQAEKIAALEAVVADLRGQLETAERAGSRNSGNSSMPPSSDGLPDGPRTCFEARKHREGRKDLVARFGGIILRQDRRAVIRDPAPAPVPYPRKELITRLRRRECEFCETGTTVAVHQVTSLKELGKPGPGQPAWAALMARMRRKTLIVCAACHEHVHANPVAHAA